MVVYINGDQIHGIYLILGPLYEAKSVYLPFQSCVGLIGRVDMIY